MGRVKLLAGVALVAICALGAPAGGVAASGQGIHFKVVSGSVHQTAFWASHSSSNDGCYIIKYNDSGSFWTDLDAKPGTIATLGTFDEVQGLQFEGKFYKDSTFDETLTPVKDQPSDCPSPDAPQYQPPSTSGCKHGADQRSPAAGNYLYLSPRNGVLGLTGVFFSPTNCPSEDSFAVEPLEPSGDVTVAKLKRVKRGKEITLTGQHRIEQSLQGVEWQGLHNRGGHTNSMIEWSVTLKRVR